MKLQQYVDIEISSLKFQIFNSAQHLLFKIVLNNMNFKTLMLHYLIN